MCGTTVIFGHHFLPTLIVALKISVSYEAFPLVFLAGILLWTFLEYTLHRFLFHMEPPKDSKILIGLHFVLHGQHHKVLHNFNITCCIIGCVCLACLGRLRSAPGAFK